MENEVLFLALAAVFGFFAAWGIGANDVANAMSTSIGSRALTIKQALLIAGVFEFAGAVLAGAKLPQQFARAWLIAHISYLNPKH